MSNLIDNRYTLQSTIGRGGMGVVYRAYDHLMGHSVALKQVSTTAMADWSQQSNTLANDFWIGLAQEFKLSASLRHPNIITVLDYGFDVHKQPYYTMELLHQPQTVLQAAHARPVNERLDLILQMLDALSYLHRRGIVHRDLKPANVLVVDDRVKVLDFGLSVMRSQSASLAEDMDTTVGTLAYIAPEILTGAPHSFQSDLYAVGMMSYEMLVGTYPFRKDEAANLINDILIKQPNFAGLQLDLTLMTLLQRLLHKQPEDRYASASDVIEALAIAADQRSNADQLILRESFLQAATFVGRDDEYAKLTAALKTVINGTGQAWLIAGESGVGKSRLLDELRTQALVRGALVMRGYASAVGSQPYQLWQGVLRWVPLLAPDLPPSQRALLRQVVPDLHEMVEVPATATALSGQQLVAHLTQLLVTILATTQRPIVILLEDLHWARTESLVFLEQLAKHLTNLPILLLASYRDDEAPHLRERFSNWHLLPLARLDSTSIEVLSEAMLGEAGRAPHVVDLLQRETEGNVLFVVEVIRALADEVGHLEQIGRMTLPGHVFAGGVQAVIQQRLARLDAHSLALLRKAAVMGRDLNLAVLERLAEDTVIDDWLWLCNEAAVLDVDGNRWSFAHDKLRLSLLDKLTPHDKQALHGAVAEAIKAQYGEDEAHIAALAYHFGQAGDAIQEERYVTFTGEHALRVGAYTEAVQHFQRATVLLPSLAISPKRIKRKQVHLLQRTAEALLGLGNYERAAELFAQSLALMKALTDPVGIAVSTGHLANVKLVMGHLDEAHTLLQSALALYQDVGNTAGIARTRNQLGDLAYERGDQDGANAHYRESLKLSRQTGKEWGIAGALSAGTVTTFPAKLKILKLQSALEQSLQTFLADGDRQAAASTFYQLGVNAHQLGQLENAAQYLREALALQRELGDTFGIAGTREQLGALAQTRQRYDDVAAHHHMLLRDALEKGVTDVVLDVLFDLAHLESQRNQNGIALEILAFLLYHPQTPEATQIEIESLVHDIERLTTDQDLTARWEAGKQHDLTKLVEALLGR